MIFYWTANLVSLVFDIVDVIVIVTIRNRLTQAPQIYSYLR